eukprot:6472950-Amphidinium_carterae.3
MRRGAMPAMVLTTHTPLSGRSNVGHSLVKPLWVASLCRKMARNVPPTMLQLQCVYHHVNSPLCLMITLTPCANADEYDEFDDDADDNADGDDAESVMATVVATLIATLMKMLMMMMMMMMMMMTLKMMMPQDDGDADDHD